MDPTVGVYVHVPFCARVCPYCDFAVEAAPEWVRGRPADFAPRETRYVDALLRELDRRAPAFAGRRLASLYFGGGTPGLLRPESVARVREAVRARFPDDGVAVETTLEINPSTVERARLPAFREAGVDRLSVGVQSFDDSLLKALGRAHRREEIDRSLGAARAAGFDNVSLDLMFAVLHQTSDMLERDLDAVLAFGPEHVSTYELVHEPRTPFGRAAATGRIAAFDADLAADMIERIEERLVAAGFERYELTNFARPGRASRHNQRYWAREPVLGIGVGAHSTDPPGPGTPLGARPANPRRLDAWLARVEAGRPAAEHVERLDVATARAEACFLALRRATGVSAEAFAAEFGGPPRDFFGEEIDRLRARALLTESPAGDLILTATGRLLADEVMAAFV
jgi:oxygen-independent coproporphyrinogen-3 oxidase